MESVDIVIDPHSLKLNQEEIWLTMGAKDGNPPDELTLNLIDELTVELLSVARPMYSYIMRNEISFKYGTIISNALKDGDRYAIIVATAGKEVDDLLKKYRDQDIIKAFVADTVASELAEATVRAAIEEISHKILPNEKMSNSYSPGYCGWLLKEQLKLFAYFNYTPCGVVLNDSCLMLPVKSVSCVVAIGENVVKAPYGCQICTKKDCYKKRDNKL